MSDPVLSQLSAVEDDLSQQVESLESELNRIKEQRDGLRTVINMFDSDGESSQPASSSTGGTKRRVGRSPGRKKTAKTPTTAKKATPAKATTAKKAKTGKKAGRKKKDGRAANWQKYVQDAYRDSALPESVSSILRSQPSEIFTIADVMTAIFREDMPRTSYLKARNRISNILSAGARDGTWYRGRNGRYSQSQSVTKM
ncbi:MAG: hypothetical protein AAF703_16845 [Cyanobacteria bacterium P01_D01_bin.105]